MHSDAEKVVIATDDARIAVVALAMGAHCCMTSATHHSGTDRLQEVVTQLQLPDEHIVVNVQGDEPLIPPAVINQVAANLAACSAASIATLAEAIHDLDQILDPNAVKVVFDQRQLALYFSRAPIPWYRDGFSRENRQLPLNTYSWRHIGIYAYRVKFLHQFVQWPPGTLEQIEMLEQLRAMEMGVAIHVSPACAVIPAGVDTPEDLARVVQFLTAEQSSL